MSSQQRVAGDTLKRAPEPERWLMVVAGINLLDKNLEGVTIVV